MKKIDRRLQEFEKENPDLVGCLSLIGAYILTISAVAILAVAFIKLLTQ